ncbi:MAG: hypothetical protein ACHP7H_00685 [Hyphomicrobiales bacterium]
MSASPGLAMTIGLCIGCDAPVPVHPRPEGAHPSVMRTERDESYVVNLCPACGVKARKRLLSGPGADTIAAPPVEEP